MRPWLCFLPLGVLAAALKLSPAHAVPNVIEVEGTIADGETVTIRGVDLTSHPDFDEKGTGYLCSWWDDFDDLASIDGAAPALTTDWTISDPQHLALEQTIARGSNSIQFLPLTFSSKTRPATPIYDTDSPWYISFWLHLPTDFDQPDEDNFQWKVVFMTGGGSGGGPGADCYLGIANDRFGWHGQPDLCDDCFDTTTNFFNVQDPVQGSPFRGQWHRVEMMVDVTHDQATVHVDGHLWHDGHALWGEDLFPDSFRLSDINIAWLDAVRTPVLTNYGYMDDYYADQTLARVEASAMDALTVDANSRLVKNVQPPRQWSSSEIEIDLNLEGLADTVYLFVIDEHGERSNGCPLAIGQGGGVHSCGASVGGSAGVAGHGGVGAHGAGGGAQAGQPSTPAQAADDCDCSTPGHRERRGNALWPLAIVLVASSRRRVSHARNRRAEAR